MSAPRFLDPGVANPRARIDPWLAVSREMAFVGEAGETDFPRLTQALSVQGGSAAWPVRFDLLFRRDPEARPMVLGAVVLRVRLVCQRCLGDLQMSLDGPLALALVRTEGEGAVLPDHLDPILVGPEGIRPLDLVEDELLLALPQIPVHDRGECGPPIAVTRQLSSPEPRRIHPFAVLQGLRRPTAEPGDEGEV